MIPNSIKQKAFYFCCCLCLMFCWGCNNINVYEWNTPISKHSWNSNAKIKGSFNIEDTAAYYNLYIIIRHTDSYNYNNIWLNVGLQYPDDTIQFKKKNLFVPKFIELIPTITTLNNNLIIPNIYPPLTDNSASRRSLTSFFSILLLFSQL